MLVLASLSLLACGGDDEDTSLEIVSLEHANLVTINGDRLPLTIHWSGEPEFPVTVSWAVLEGECPSDVQCTDEQHEVSSEANPIVVQEALWCTGYGPGWTAPWDVTLEDANGARSAPARMEYSCR
jgi:hypothetical protein